MPPRPIVVDAIDLILGGQFNLFLGLSASRDKSSQSRNLYSSLNVSTTAMSYMLPPSPTEDSKAGTGARLA